MRKLTLSLLILAFTVPLAHAAPVEVLVKDNFFKPDEVTIDKGDRVTWLWRGDNVHNVALKKPGSNSISRASEFKTKGSFTHKFRRVGTWRVLCETHPRKMRMRVIVRRP
jgi:plastocyanin